MTVQYLPFYRKEWKESTADRSEQTVTKHLVPELGDRLLQVISREDLQKVLDGKARKLSYSVMAKSGWFLNAIFKLALSDGCTGSNPAAELIIPKKCKAARDMRALTVEEVNHYLEVFDLREKLIARLADFRRDAPGRDPGAQMEVSAGDNHGGRARLQAGA
jgi:hypothetical protein